MKNGKRGMGTKMNWRLATAMLFVGCTLLEFQYPQAGRESQNGAASRLKYDTWES